MKTYDECCHDVAVKHGLGKSLVIGHAPKYWKEAAEAYAKEYHASQSPAVTPSKIEETFPRLGGTCKCGQPYTSCRCHESANASVAEVRELPTEDDIENYCIKNSIQPSYNPFTAFTLGAYWMRDKASPIISPLKSEIERLKAELEGKEDRAVEFAEWLAKEGWDYSLKKDNTWVRVGEYKTTSELYQIFLKETSSKGEGKE